MSESVEMMLCLYEGNTIPRIVVRRVNSSRSETYTVSPEEALEILLREDIETPNMNRHHMIEEIIRIFV